jgi:uncharacterized protein YjiS (DUF1127 family)
MTEFIVKAGIIAGTPHMTGFFAVFPRGSETIFWLHAALRHCSAAGLTQEEKMTSPSLSIIRPNRPSGLLLNGLDRLCAWIYRKLATAMTLWIIRRDERMLLEMPDHQLKDLGIGRADIPRVVREGRR